VAQGLAYAHVRGLVHRDIKPANLLFDEEGRVRVADFGVARALAEAAWTEPAGAMVGTARYISPEAAEGKPVDGRADVYSLALVLYEAVTGTVPFVTDTTMGTLAARIGQPLPHDEALGPLDDVLARAAAPDVAARLDAAGLAARLGALAAALPTPAPLPLVIPHLEAASPIAGFRPPGVPELTDPGAVAAAAAAGGTTTSSTAIAPSLKDAPVGTRAGPGEIFDAEPFGGSGAAAGGGGGKGKGPKSGLSRIRRRTWWIVAAIAVAVIVAGGLVAAFEAKVFTPSHPTPSLVNLPLAQARVDVAKVHMTLKAGAPVTSITVSAGSVVSQKPSAGTSLREGSTVTVVVSSGKPDVTVPSLAGMTCAQATTALQGAHFQSVCAPGTYSNTIATGVLVLWSIGSTSNPTKAPYGSTITLVPSLGHQPATVPSIPNTYTFAQAQAALQAVGLTATQANQSSATVASGDVISTTPASGAQAPYGSAVTVNVSTGPPTTPVPDVIGDSVSQATSALQQDGLSVSGVSGSPNNNVTGTQPSVGSTVDTGSSVVLYTH
jgi:serine/threonine-protein kinase